MEHPSNPVRDNVTPSSIGTAGSELKRALELALQNNSGLKRSRIDSQSSTPTPEIVDLPIQQAIPCPLPILNPKFKIQPLLSQPLALPSHTMASVAPTTARGSPTIWFPQTQISAPSQGYENRKSCEHCRTRHTKCPGGPAPCKSCFDRNIPCIFALKKKRISRAPRPVTPVAGQDAPAMPFFPSLPILPQQTTIAQPSAPALPLKGTSMTTATLPVYPPVLPDFHAITPITNGIPPMEVMNPISLGTNVTPPAEVASTIPSAANEYTLKTRQSCIECSSQHQKCSGSPGPCKRCVDKGNPCVFLLKKKSGPKLRQPN